MTPCIGNRAIISSKHQIDPLSKGKIIIVFIPSLFHVVKYIPNTQALQVFFSETAVILSRMVTFISHSVVICMSSCMLTGA